MIENVNLNLRSCITGATDGLVKNDEQTFDVDKGIFGASEQAIDSKIDESTLKDLVKGAITGPADTLIDVQDNNKSDNNFIDFIKKLIGVKEPIK